MKNVFLKVYYCKKVNPNLIDSETIFLFLLTLFLWLFMSEFWKFNVFFFFCVFLFHINFSFSILHWRQCHVSSSSFSYFFLFPSLTSTTACFFYIIFVSFFIPHLFCWFYFLFYFQIFRGFFFRLLLFIFLYWNNRTNKIFWLQTRSVQY